MAYAWIENGKVRDVCYGEPDSLYHPSVASYYDTQVSDTVKNGWDWDGTTATEPVTPEPVTPEPQPVVPPKLTPVQFKMCFTSAERIAIKTARGTDPVLDDAYELLDDPRLTEVDLSLQSTIGMIDYMVTQNLITSERAVDIKLGQFM